MEQNRSPWKPKGLYIIACFLLWAASWFLPVIKDGTRLANGTLPGWEAFRVALSPVWHYNPHISPDCPMWGQILFVASGLSNFVFLGALFFLFRPSLNPKVWKILLACTCVNLHWLQIIFSDIYAMKIGYYMWVSSFFILTGLLLLNSRHGKFNECSLI